MDQELGRGRSGIVYRSSDDAGRETARKVFGSSGSTKAVQYLFLGAPNPYLWCEAAVRTAVLRRRIASELARFWFGEKLHVARAYGHDWEPNENAFQIHCELITGRHVALRHPFTLPGESELRDLARGVMKPLQKHLADAGLDGLVWQAGRGNPVALNNFMCTGPDENGGFRWAWIDLESGVPALIPINPLDLLFFYLPKSLRHRRPLFDDVDVDKLRAYVRERMEDMRSKLGTESVRELEANIDSLAESQQEWKSLPRHARSVCYRRSTGAITEAQAEWYVRHPWAWYCRESGRALDSAKRVFKAGIAKCLAALARISLPRMMQTFWRAVRSQDFRVQMARDYIGSRIDRWRERGQLDAGHAEALRNDLNSEEAGSYLTDFGVHMAVKPVVKLVEWWMIPALWMAGAINDFWLGVCLVGFGPCVRTLYTAGRLIQNALAGRQRPWIALFTGAVPVIGNVAYPLQIIVNGAAGEAAVARFIIYDTFSRLGQWFPIWGGADTLTEHLLNRCPSAIMRSAHAPALRRENEVSDGGCPADFEGIADSSHGSRAARNSLPICVPSWDAAMDQPQHPEHPRHPSCL